MSKNSNNNQSRNLVAVSFENVDDSIASHEERCRFDDFNSAWLLRLCSDLAKDIFGRGESKLDQASSDVAAVAGVGRVVAIGGVDYVFRRVLNQVKATHGRVQCSIDSVDEAGGLISHLCERDAGE
jgi:hypothetical protein